MFAECATVQRGGAVVVGGGERGTAAAQPCRVAVPPVFKPA